MKAIVVAGHSAGGQFANRYEMSNKIHDTLGVPITYVVANPSSYAWPDAVRPLPQGDADPATAKEGWNQRDQTPLPAHTEYTFGPFDASKAPYFNRWPSGFENRTGYNASLTDAQLKKQLVERPTTYLLGQVDTLPLGGFDSSANAMAQGPTRRSRGEAYFKYVTETLGAKHTIMIVPECGHNDRCMYTTNIVFPVVFPKASGASSRLRHTTPASSPQFAVISSATLRTYGSRRNVSCDPGTATTDTAPGTIRFHPRSGSKGPSSGLARAFTTMTRPSYPRGR